MGVKWTAAHARDLAKAAHAGATDKAGRPYFGHVERVADYVRDTAAHLTAREQDYARQVAFLHDVVEDTDTTFADLTRAGAPVAVVVAVEAITHRRGEPYADYIRRVRANKIARAVKLADLRDNTDPARVAAAADGDAAKQRRANKYALAKELLNA